jgi:hypothetical protein
MLVIPETESDADAASPDLVPAERLEAKRVDRQEALVSKR